LSLTVLFAVAAPLFAAADDPLRWHKSPAPGHGATTELDVVNP